ncbi:MAG: hypothetical protein FWD56_04270 [Bacteroidales bacterium]|nr:hypothetical protein [Bacteroidales bacterium]
MKNIINKIAFFLLAFGAIATSCKDSSDWEPGPELADNVHGIHFNLDRSPQSLMLGPDDPSYLIVTLGRHGNKVASSLEVPVTILSADPGLFIPTSVTFAAGSAFAELKIEITLSDWESLSYSLKVDENQFSTYTKGVSFFNGEVFFDPGSVSPENIATYKQPSNVLARDLFMTTGRVDYTITQMSPKYEQLFDDYKEIWPYTHQVITVRSSATRLFVFTFYYTPNATWLHEPLDSEEGIFAMGPPNNGLCDVTFNIPRFTNRSNLPFSASGFASAAGGALIQEYRAFIQDPAGFTIIVDRDKAGVFWFRSKANPNDWFKCERN